MRSLFWVIIVVLSAFAAFAFDSWWSPFLEFLDLHGPRIQALQSLVQLILWVGAASAAVFAALSVGRLRKTSTDDRPNRLRARTYVGGNMTVGGDYINGNQINMDRPRDRRHVD